MSPLLRILVTVLSCASSIQAIPQATRVNKVQLPSRSLQIRANSYEINPTEVPWPPSCATEDTKSCLGASIVSGCTNQYCSKKVALTCWTHYYLIDLSCLCKSMSSSTCSACSSGISNQLYLTWLAENCVLAPGWDGIPADWDKSLPPWNMVRVGGANGGGQYSFVNTFVNQFVPDKNIYIRDGNPLDCTTSCTWWMNSWTDASYMVDGSAAVSILSSQVFTPNYAAGGAPQANNLYLDLARFCIGWTLEDYENNCPSSCDSGLDPTRFVIWVHKTCGSINGFTGLPSNWDDLLVVVNSTYPALSGFKFWPSCANSTTTSCLSTRQSECTSTRCVLDANGDCSSSTTAIGLQCVCSGLNKIGCTGCSSNIDSTTFLLWTNKTCSAVPGFQLPGNWQDSLFVVNSSYPPLSSFNQGPSCTNSSSTSCVSASLSQCTSTRCIIDSNGDCSSSTTAVGLDCLCSSLSSTACTQTCSMGIDSSEYLLWLDKTCSNRPGFKGLPSNWRDSLVVVNSSYPALSKFQTWPSCASSGNNSNCQFKTKELGCTSMRCNLDASDNCNPTSAISRSCMCSNANSSSCTQDCSSYANSTSFLLWLNQTCTQIPGWVGLPSHWTENLITINKTLLPSSTFHYPKCLASGDGKSSNCQLSKIEAECSNVGCMNETLNVNGSCPNEKVVSLNCFCPSVRYGTTCTGSCIAPQQRSDYLTWIYDTCSPAGIGDSLPSNWKSLLEVMRSDLFPWKWKLVSVNLDVHCPSSTGILVTFAVVNIFIFFLMPLIGRRTIIKMLTFRLLGKLESCRHWYLTGPFAAGLHLASNAINATIVKHTSGYDGASIPYLTLLWCTRPRISWLLIALISFQADRNMYLSAAASTLTSEIILQLIGAYFIGTTADRGRAYNLYHKGVLTGTSFENATLMMYAGALLWVVVLPFAIAACAWSIWRLNERIKMLCDYLIQANHQARKNQRICDAKVQALNSKQSKFKPASDATWQDQLQEDQNLFSTTAVGLIADWNEIKELWNQMPPELKTATKERRTKQENMRKAQIFADKEPDGSDRHRLLHQKTMQDAEKYEKVWKSAPLNHQNSAGVRLETQRTHLASNESEQAALNRRLLRFYQRIQSYEERGLDDDTLLRSEKLKAADFEVVYNAWRELVASRQALVENWETYQEEWRRIADDRGAPPEPPTISNLPFIVVGGMLLCWIAQWLWWAGYVELAGDDYCPPKLPVLAVIWIICSALGIMAGASF